MKSVKTRAVKKNNGKLGKPSLAKTVNVTTPDQFNIPGAAIGVVENGQLIHCSGMGVLDVDNQCPVKADSVFQAASISKLVNALGILRLAELGQIKLGG